MTLLSILEDRGLSRKGLALVELSIANLLVLSSFRLLELLSFILLISMKVERAVCAVGLHYMFDHITGEFLIGIVPIGVPVSNVNEVLAM